jgi:hypothetical protein
MTLHTGYLAVRLKEFYMTKSQAIRQVNEIVGLNHLNFSNTHWSSIVEYRSEAGWWLNVPFQKFSQNLSLILNNEENRTFIHIEIPANSIKNAELVFRNKSGKADIFMPFVGSDRLIDTQSGSSRHDFSQYLIKEY